jgi:hypothetical protein
LLFRIAPTTIVDRKARPAAKPEEHHYETLELSDLRDISSLHIL